MNTLLNRLSPAIASLLLSAPALAIEQAPAEVPIDTVNPLWVMVFFVACVGGVVWYIVATNKASKNEAKK